MSAHAQILWLALVAALSLQVQGQVRGSFLSNRRDVKDVCYESVVVEGVSCAGAAEGALGAHPADCRAFYQCAGGVAFCMRCPPGLHFNPALKVCDDPQRAGCVTDLQVNPADDAAVDDIPQLCVDESVSAVSCASGAGASDDKLLPHPDDCRLFYYCVSADAAPVCRLCPAGLHFNPSLHVCDNPQDAGCQVNA